MRYIIQIYAPTKKNLVEHINQAPQIFKNTNIILDFNPLKDEIDIHIIRDFVQMFAQHDLYVLGIKSLPHAKITPSDIPTIHETKPSNNNDNQLGSLIIDKPIRSGQQIYAKNKHLVVLNNISHGAEIIADGDIHIYGALNGKALAGAQNNIEAHIFCQACNAEMISIAGYYWDHQEIQNKMLQGRSLHISLRENALTHHVL